MPDLQLRFLRLYHILGRRAVTEEEAERNRRDAKAAKESGRTPNNRPKRGRDAVPPIIPISNSNWWAGIKTGKYPKPVKLGPRTTVWRAKDIQALVERINDNGSGE